MRGTLFVGLDVGTTTSKAVVFTEDGEPVASGRATTPWTVTTSGAELDAERACSRPAKSAVAEALAGLPARTDRRPRGGEHGRVRVSAGPARRARRARDRLARHPRPGGDSMTCATSSGVRLLGDAPGCRSGSSGR